MRPVAIIAVSVVLTLAGVAFGAYGIGRGFNGAENARAVICDHMDTLVRIERDRLLRARTATRKQAYYLAHPDELRSYVDRSVQAVNDLGKVTC